MTPREIIAKGLADTYAWAPARSHFMADAAIEALTSAGYRILGPGELDEWTLEKAAAYVEGQGGRIPGSVAFASLVSGNRQPCMSGDARDRLYPHTRRAFDDATTSLATAIRALAKEKQG